MEKYPDPKQWSDIKGFEGLYQIRMIEEEPWVEIKSVLKFGKILKFKVKSKQYIITLFKDKKSKQFPIQKIVAEQYIPNPNFRKILYHINGFKKDNRIENLEWCSHKEKLKKKKKIYYLKNKEKIKEYYENNKEKKKEYYKKWREKNERYGKKWREENKRYSTEYYENNKEKIKEYYLKNKEKIKEYYEKNKEKRKEYYENNKEKIKEYYEKYNENKENKEKIKEYGKKWREENKRYSTEYCKKRLKNDLNFKFRKVFANRIKECIKKGYKSARSQELLGCTTQEAREHLEKQFKEGMTWNNHGIDGWHIDHIIPCASFDLTDPEQQKKCFHYTNLQPLWAKENMSKGSKIPYMGNSQKF